MKRGRKLGLLSLPAMLCALTLVLTQVSAQQEPPAPGRGQNVAAMVITWALRRNL